MFYPPAFYLSISWIIETQRHFISRASRAFRDSSISSVSLGIIGYRIFQNRHQLCSMNSIPRLMEIRGKGIILASRRELFLVQFPY